MVTVSRPLPCGGRRRATSAMAVVARMAVTMMLMMMMLMMLMMLVQQSRILGIEACTDILVTPGASVDGSAMIAYNADSPTLYGVLYHYPRQEPQNQQEDEENKENKNKKRKIYDWDSGKYLGEIDERTDEETYNVVGNANEHGLVIGETTFGGVAVLAWNQSEGILDYGSLIYITLQRAKTARQAISVMTQLMDTYGYYSGGESFSLADSITGEVWMMEVIGRGSDPAYGRRGATWVAVRIPDGAVAAHANQARITTFARDDPDNCLYADDVMDLAVHYGLYPPPPPSLDGPNIHDEYVANFSFSDVYDPVDFLNARHAEARVWSIFSQIVDDTGDFQASFQNYAAGLDCSHRMPLYVYPQEKLSLPNVMHLMSSHYEGTILDSSLDVGSGMYGSPYRPLPLVWTYNNQTYHNERKVATSKTGWNFIAQIRPWMPPLLAALIWFACDDSSTAPRVPVYASSTRIAPPYAGQGPQDGVVSPLLQLDLSKAFWVQNMVSNFAYYRWSDVYPILQERITGITMDFVQQVATTDRLALDLFYNNSMANNERAVQQFVTSFSVRAGNALHKEWMNFYGELFVQFRDGFTIVPKKDDPLCNCQAKQEGFSDAVKKRIVDETGDHYKVMTTTKTTKKIGSARTVPIVRGERDEYENVMGVMTTPDEQATATTTTTTATKIRGASVPDKTVTRQYE